MFGLRLFHPSMTYRKREFSKCSVQQGNTQKVLGCLGNFSFVEVSYECMMVARLKRIFEANAIVLSIFFGGVKQVQVLGAIHHKRSL